MRDAAMGLVQFDGELNNFPYAMVFFMFRAGAHQTALDFLSRPGNLLEVR